MISSAGERISGRHDRVSAVWLSIQQQQWESTSALHSPSPSGREKERKGRIPGNIYERLELVVRERIEHDKCLSHGDGLPTPKMSPLVPKGHHQAHATRAESVRLPPQSLRDTNTSTPSISPPVRVPWYKVEEEAKSSRKKEGSTP